TVPPTSMWLSFLSWLVEITASKGSHARGLRRTNQRAAARDPLRRALDVAEAFGASPLADLARRERRIAEMAANGLSNPEIAQALFMTKKTVETHLSNAYRKLDIRSRT